jgi:xanthine dehydrogenase accessory factor
MTHSHQLDEDICFQALQRGDFAWLGLIGSETKRRRFVHRLGQRGIGPAQLEMLVCPIGLSGIRGKQPATIALSLAAQLMTLVNDHGWGPR